MRRAFRALTFAATAFVFAAHAQAPERSMLWRVRAGAGPPVYLAGSIHVLSKEFYPLPDSWNRAFEAATVLVEEIDLTEADDPTSALGFLNKGVLPDSQALRDVIAADLYDRVIARGASLGLPAIALQRMKPWMVAVTLAAPELRNAGFDPALGVDRHFFERAREAQKEQRALETVAFQLDRLDQLSLPLQTQMLRSAVDDVESDRQELTAITEAWRVGNVTTLERLLLRTLLESPELYERLLVERNRSWVAPVEQCLTSKAACFVVVGAAHLVGPHSLVALLRDKGYAVEQQ